MVLLQRYLSLKISIAKRYVRPTLNFLRADAKMHRFVYMLLESIIMDSIVVSIFFNLLIRSASHTVLLKPFSKRINPVNEES